MKPVFHGELTLTPTNEIPTGTLSKHKTYIAGHSETGHHHVIESDVEFDRIMTDEGIYLRLYDVARLYHKKERDRHEDIILEPGLYKLGEKTEYNPWTKTIQRVFD